MKRQAMGIQVPDIGLVKGRKDEAKSGIALAFFYGSQIVHVIHRLSLKTTASIIPGECFRPCFSIASGEIHRRFLGASPGKHQKALCKHNSSSIMNLTLKAHLCCFRKLTILSPDNMYNQGAENDCKSHLYSSLHRINDNYNRS